MPSSPQRAAQPRSCTASRLCSFQTVCACSFVATHFGFPRELIANTAPQKIPRCSVSSLDKSLFGHLLGCIRSASKERNARRLLAALRRKASIPKRRQFVPFCHRIPCHQFNLGHSLHQSNPLRMITSERQQASMRLDVLKRYQNRL